MKAVIMSCLVKVTAYCTPQRIAIQLKEMKKY
jgi:hypothetical protein